MRRLSNGKTRLGTLFAAIMTAIMLGTPAAMAASSSYYAKTDVYFNVPSDATFSIAMPSDYGSWTSITATEEGSATATDHISFNFTSGTESGIQPYQLGDDANAQSGFESPIFYIDNTGNVNEKFEIKFNETAPSGISVSFNATCGSGSCSGTAQADPKDISDAYQQIIDSLTNAEYLNVTLYANVTGGSGGLTYRTIYIKSTAV